METVQSSYMYVDPPDIPPAMTIAEYRRARRRLQRRPGRAARLLRRGGTRRSGARS
jgi:hypothetical protein